MSSVNLGRVVGYSAYEIAVQNGFVGTEAEWLASLKGDDGQTGPAGQDGQDGAAATIEVGTVTTGAAGSNAVVTNVGTSSAAIFNFTIPQGQPGASGSSDWSDVTNKPFNSIGSGLTVTSGVLSADPSFDTASANTWMENNFGAVAAETTTVTITESTTVPSGQTYVYFNAVSASDFSWRDDVTLTCDSTDTYTLTWDDMSGKWEDPREGISLEPLGGSYRFDIPNYFTYSSYVFTQNQTIIVTQGEPFDEQYIPDSIARLRDIPGNELPTISSGDAGKVLTVNSNEDGVEWAAAGGGSFDVNAANQWMAETFGAAPESEEEINIESDPVQIEDAVTRYTATINDELSPDESVFVNFTDSGNSLEYVYDDNEGGWGYNDGNDDYWLYCNTPTSANVNIPAEYADTTVDTEFIVQQDYTVINDAQPFDPVFVYVPTDDTTIGYNEFGQLTLLLPAAESEEF